MRPGVLQRLVKSAQSLLLQVVAPLPLLFLFLRPFQQGVHILAEGVIFLFLPLYLPKFRLQGGLAGGESFQFCFHLIGGRKFGEPGLFDFPGGRLE